ncbi:SDR family oxidoreductase [Catellatospora methionotrophica]|uniref:SDR family oxidoreductase n=1 Tax=Catellatospora methionotrophica TaxID=121620 RepID=UPI0033E35C51
MTERVLLTGATGFVGSFLLKTLLTATDADVVCLVRAQDPATGWRRLGEGLAWGAEPLPSRRITIVTSCPSPRADTARANAPPNV